ncbi:MAG: SDR family NAD(P)-dependent oxidoreductase [Bacteroidia bacterium]|nr:SDR family NAD(P)-dependent oxidoreductase [Bacteroidia bacterium]MCZ2278074.1 SDR family NAD(P)-dependent oxidoreductase [Bacteroidia bacterium]
MILNNKIAIVTGATGGLGSAISLALISKGAIVYAIGRNAAALERLRSNAGERVKPVQLDLTKEQKVTEWVSNTFTENHYPDVLINNAGVGTFSKIDETPSSKWHEMIDTNLNGMYYITSQVATMMKKKTTGSHIINIGSILGKTGRTEGAAYCTTKFGVSGFSEALYIELRHFNIKVTCVNPGSIETGFFKSSGIESHSNMLHPPDLADIILHVLQTPDNMLINELTIRPLNPKAPVR